MAVTVNCDSCGVECSRDVFSFNFLARIEMLAEGKAVDERLDQRQENEQRHMDLCRKCHDRVMGAALREARKGPGDLTKPPKRP